VFSLDPSRVYYIKLNTILTDMFLGRSRQVKLYDKNSGEIPAEDTTLN
jgi:hypothetical protein